MHELRSWPCRKVMNGASEREAKSVPFSLSSAASSRNAGGFIAPRSKFPAGMAMRTIFWLICGRAGTHDLLARFASAALRYPKVEV